MTAWEEVFSRAAELRAAADSAGLSRLERELEAVNVDGAQSERTPSPTNASSATAEDSSSTTSAAASSDAPLFEGVFLQTLYNRLDSLYENNFNTNLKLTSLLSRLAHVPHVLVHDFLYATDSSWTTRGGDPSSSSAPAAAAGSGSVEGGEPLLSVLARVWKKGLKRAARMQNFARRKEEVRSRLNAQLATPGVAQRSDMRICTSVIQARASLVALSSHSTLSHHFSYCFQHGR